MRGFRRVVVLVPLCVALFSAAAFAQASIAGVVKDTSGAVLPGVTVEAASPALTERTRAVVTDSTGQFKIVNLVPGTYGVTFSLTGFNTVKRDGVELTGSFTATVSVDMKVGAVEETITVAADTPVVDIQSATRQRVLNTEVVDNVPTSRLPFTLAVLIPGVSARTGAGDGLVQDVGGSQGTVQSATLVVHGSHPDSLRLTYNGLVLATQETGRNAGAVENPSAYQEMTIDTSAVSAELATGGVRINLIPKEGGNSLHGSVIGGGMSHAMQGDNLSPELQAAGLTTPNRLKKMWDFNPSVGGPIVKDTLWFFATGRYRGDQTYAAGIFYNANALNPNLWTYQADPSLGQPSNNNSDRDYQGRITWQISPKYKLGLAGDFQDWNMYPNAISATSAPENATNTQYPLKRMLLADLTAPLTNRLLLEVVVSRQDQNTVRPLSQPVVAVTEQSTGLTYHGQGGTFNQNRNGIWYYRAAVSYVTGAHATKVGFNNGSGYRNNLTNDNIPIAYRFNNGVPNQITQRTTPFSVNANLDADLGLFAQDKWTIGRLTLTYGARLDYFKSSFPEQHVGPVPLAPDLNLTIPETPGIRGWKDVTPKSGVVYDLTGDGKTALKVSINKYVSGQTLGATDNAFGPALNPTSTLVTTTTRTWNDSNKNFVPDCVLTNTAANNECLGVANTAFGTQVFGTSYDPETLSGWNHRAYNWEFATGVQRQLLPRVSADVSYFRRWYGNFVITDNLATPASAYSTFSIPAPTSAALPGGGGYTVSGLYNLDPAFFGLPTRNYVTFADNYGKQTEHWNGIDATIDTRLGRGMLLQGGISSGRTVVDNCEVAAAVPGVLQQTSTTVNAFGLPTPLSGVPSGVWTPLQSCHQSSGFRTQLKGFASYTVPKVDLRVSGSFQSVAGDIILADYNAPNSVVAPSLGRPLSGGAANITVNVLQPGTQYGARVNQLDLRFSRAVPIARTRVAINLDLYNVFNMNTVLTVNPNFGSFMQPTTILPARFFKIGALFTF